MHLRILHASFAHLGNGNPCIPLANTAFLDRGPDKVLSEIVPLTRGDESAADASVKTSGDAHDSTAIRERLRSPTIAET